MARGEWIVLTVSQPSGEYQTLFLRWLLSQLVSVLFSDKTIIGESSICQLHLSLPRNQFSACEMLSTRVQIYRSLICELIMSLNVSCWRLSVTCHDIIFLHIAKHRKCSFPTMTSSSNQDENIIQEMMNNHTQFRAKVSVLCLRSRPVHASRSWGL